MDPRLLKKPKLEEPSDVAGGESGRGRGDGGVGGRRDNEPDALQEQEEALVALIEHRSKEYEHLKQKVAYFKSQLDEAEKKLNDSKAKLARLRARAPSRTAASDEARPVRTESRSSSPGNINGSRPQLLIPSASTKVPSQAVNNAKSKVLHGTSSRGASSPAQSSLVDKSSSRIVSEKSSVQEKTAKRKIGSQIVFFTFCFPFDAFNIILFYWCLVFCSTERTSRFNSCCTYMFIAEPNQIPTRQCHL
ncbi:hypothetical protein COCNU_scaffold030607G000010 [Cocos nucifera]|nr:hypothetical protein [Cocos nucifera]